MSLAASKLWPLMVKAPTDTPWIGLVEALGWVRTFCALDEDLMFTDIPVRLGKSMEEVRQELETTWRKLADRAAAGKIAIRGWVFKGRREQSLGPDDLRACQNLIVLHEGGRIIVSIERSDDPFSNVFARLGDEERGDPVWDFHSVVVNREQLLHEFPPPGQKIVTAQAAQALHAQAVTFLKKSLERLENEDPRCKPKARLIAALRDPRGAFGLSRDRALDAWREASEPFPDFRKAGRPPGGIIPAKLSG